MTRNDRAHVLATGWAVATLLWAVPSAFAAPGGLDPTFDGDGRVTTDLGNDLEGANAIALQSDGKIVALGYAYDSDFNRQSVLVRYDVNGARDATFADDGILVFDTLEANGLAVQADDSIVVVGTAENAFAIARFSAGGIVDSEFGNGGLQTTEFAGLPRANAFDVAVQPDGKLVVAGMASSVAGDFAVTRYNPDGAPDDTFSHDGQVRTNVFGESDGASALALQPNGKIVVVGFTIDRPRQETLDFAVVRYRPDGTLDSRFSNDGKLKTNFGTVDHAFDVVLQPDRRIVVIGRTEGAAPTLDFALARYRPDGTLDHAFSSDGRRRTDFGGEDSGFAVAIQPNSKIVAAGWASGSFAVARYKSDGPLDRRFGGDGKQTTRFGPSGRDYGRAMLLQADTRIVVAGEVTPLSGRRSDFGLARYLP